MPAADPLCWMEGIRLICGYRMTQRPMVVAFGPRAELVEHAQELRAAGWVWVSVRDRTTGERVQEGRRCANGNR